MWRLFQEHPGMGAETQRSICFSLSFLLSKKVLSVGLEGMQDHISHPPSASACLKFPHLDNKGWISAFIWPKPLQAIFTPPGWKKKKNFMVEKSRAIKMYVCPCSLQSQCCLCNSSFSIILPSWCLSNSAVRKDLSCIASMSSISSCQVGAASFKHADGAHLSINVSGKEETRLDSHTQRQQ